MEDKIIDLHNEGFEAGKIAQKLKVKKAVVEEVLNETNEQNQGFGDTVEKVLENTGIKNIVEKFTDATGIDCGCAARREWLNGLFPNRKMNDLSKDDYAYLTEVFKLNLSTLTREQNAKITEIYNNVFNTKQKATGCTPCAKTRVMELKRVYDRASE